MRANHTDFIFREVRTVEESLKVLKLRHRVLRTCRLRNLCSESEFGIDIDSFDLHARHFALLERNGEVVGCQRGVYPHGEIESPLARELLTKMPELQELVSTDARPFPCFAYLSTSEAEAIGRLSNRIGESGGQLGESARFLIDPHVSTIQIATFMAKAIVAAYIVTDPRKHGITLVVKSHKRFYQRLGFQAVAETNDKFSDAVGSPGCVLHIHHSLIPEALRPELEAMAEEFVSTGRLIYRGTAKSEASAPAQVKTTAPAMVKVA